MGAACEWYQLHLPKHLALALWVEAVERLRHCHWLAGADSAALPQRRRPQIAEEMAGGMLYLVRPIDSISLRPAQRTVRCAVLHENIRSGRSAAVAANTPNCEARVAHPQSGG